MKRITIILSILIICGVCQKALAQGCVAIKGTAGVCSRPTDYKGWDLRDPNPEICRRECAIDRECRAYTFVKPGVQTAAARCRLKNRVPPPVPSNCCISGVKEGHRR